MTTTPRKIHVNAEKTYNRNQEIYEAWKLGEPLKDIAKRYGISPARVSTLANEVAIRRGTRKSR